MQEKSSLGAARTPGCKHRRRLTTQSAEDSSTGVAPKFFLEIIANLIEHGWRFKAKGKASKRAA